MTENQWQEMSDPYPAKKDAVKGGTASVASQAAGSVRNVAAAAGEETANVASEVRASARGLVNQAKSDLAAQVATQERKAAEGIHAISAQLRGMADAPAQQGVASDLIRQAADRSASIAAWLEDREPGALLEEAKSFARRRPGVFLLLAAGAGIVAGRVGRSLQSEAPSATPSNAAVPLRTTQRPVPTAARHLETVIAAGTGDHFFEVPTGSRAAAPITTASGLEADI